jgi:hypothetical protein
MTRDSRERDTFPTRTANRDRGFVRASGKRQAEVIIDVDDGALQLRPIEQSRLRLTVGFERSVIVQVIAVRFVKIAESKRMPATRC